MEKEFVPYDIALAMKELGFNEECLAVYVERMENVWLVSLPLPRGYSKKALAPLYQQAFRWFRETYQFVGTILGDGLNGELKGYYYSITEDGWLNFYESVDSSKWYDTYEEAELACLKKLIEIVKEKPKQR